MKAFNLKDQSIIKKITICTIAAILILSTVFSISPEMLTKNIVLATEPDSSENPIQLDLSAPLEETRDKEIEITAKVTSNAKKDIKITDKQIDAGSNHTIALKSDGTVWTWGDGYSGKLGNNSTARQSTPVKVEGLTDVIAISAGNEHSLALKSDGTVWVWGSGAYGLFGTGDNQWGNESTPHLVKNLTDIVKISAGSNHNVALKADGTVWSWGNQRYGLGTAATSVGTSTPVKANITDVKEVAAGSDLTLALKSDGTVWAWGQGSSGKLGNGQTVNSPVPVKTSNLSGVASIFANGNHSLALQSSSLLWTWGSGNLGQLGNGTKNPSSLPIQPNFPFNSKFITAAAGQTHSLAVKSDGTVWTWGNGGSGRLGNGVIADSNVPVQAKELTDVVVVAGGSSHSIAVKSDGTVWTWGDNFYGQLGNGSTERSILPNKMPDFNLNVSTAKIVSQKWSKGNQAISYFKNSGTSFEGNKFKVKENGVYTVYGQDELGNENVKTIEIKNIYTEPVGVKIDLSASPSDWTNQDVKITSEISTNAERELVFTDKQVDAGNSHTVVLKADGTVWTWGSGINGKLGNDSTTDQKKPVKVKGLTDVVEVSAGSEHTMALKADGTVWVWGSGNNGRLASGNNRWGSSAVPIQAMNLSNVVAISAGNDHNVALKSDGTVWSWGNERYGQTGSGNTSTGTSTPVQAKNLTNVIAISAGNGRTMALKSDGTVWAWGDSYLGDGKNESSSIPVQVNNLTDISAISAGSNHILALKTTKTLLKELWAWGAGNIGQLGNGGKTASAVPIQVSDVVNSEFQSISAGSVHSLAIRTGGTVWAWGRGSNGQLGNDSKEDSSIPVKTKDLTDVAVVSGGNNHSVALKNDGSIWTWGDNYYGQLGDDSKSSSSVPVEIKDFNLGSQTVNIVAKKWALGNQPISHFEKAGWHFEGDSFTVSQNGIYTVYAKDDAGNENVKTIEIKQIDKVKPEVKLLMTPIEITNDDVTVTTDVSDALSGIKETRWSEGHNEAKYFRDGGGFLVENNEFKVNQNGDYTVYAVDKAGNETVLHFKVENINKDPLFFGLSLDPEVWTNKNVKVNLEIEKEDISKVAEVKYAKGEHKKGYFLSNGTSTESLSFVASENGIYTAYLKDLAGNEFVRTIEVANIDRIAPKLNLDAAPNATSEGVKITLDIEENESGKNLQKWAFGEQSLSYFQDDSNGTHILGNSFFANKVGTYTVYISDVAGNEALKTIQIEEVEVDLPDKPTFSANPITETQKEVTITINYIADAKVKQYRIINADGEGTWTNYTNPFKVTKNGMVEAKVQNQDGIWSDVAFYAINNIVKPADGNNTPDNGMNKKEYMLPLQQSSMKSLGSGNGKRQFELEYKTDMFFMTKYTGFQEAYTYSNDVLANFRDGIALPNYAVLMKDANRMMQVAYENKTGSTYMDEVLYTESQDDFEKLQRYYVPISPDSKLKPETVYQNITSVQNIGMNDVTIEFDTSFSFEQYLIGSGADNAWIIEQTDERQSIEGASPESIHTIKLSDAEVEELAGKKQERTKERLHEFRFADRTFTDMVNDLFNLGF